VLLNCADGRLTALRKLFESLAFHEDLAVLRLRRTMGSLDYMTYLHFMRVYPCLLSTPRKSGWRWPWGSGLVGVADSYPMVLSGRSPGLS